MSAYPTKLKKDAVVEALLEIRFETDQLGEIILGKLASNERWKNLQVQRLPLADLPAQLRAQTPDFAHQPILQLVTTDGSRLVKIGDRVLSYHALGKYPGWEVLEPELAGVIDFMYGVLAGVTATRFGFRYVNVLTSSHGLSGIADLNVSVKVADQILSGPLNLNYGSVLDSSHSSLVRIASRDFVQNPLPMQSLVALIDVDIFTPGGLKSQSSEDAKAWVTRAHEFLKHEFFKLLTPDQIRMLAEEG